MERKERSGDEVCWVFVGVLRGAQCPSLCEDGWLLMSCWQDPKSTELVKVLHDWDWDTEKGRNHCSPELGCDRGSSLS